MSTRVFRSKFSSVLVFMGLGSFLIAPPILLMIFGGDAAGAGIALLFVTGIPGICMLLFGLAFRGLRITISEDFIDLHLPRAGAWGLFPWQVRYVRLTWSNLKQVDVKSRPNPMVLGGIEYLTFLRSPSGDFYFNSVWFSDYDELYREILEHCQAPTTSEDLTQPPIPGIQRCYCPIESCQHDHARVWLDWTGSADIDCLLCATGRPFWQAPRSLGSRPSVGNCLTWLARHPHVIAISPTDIGACGPTTIFVKATTRLSCLAVSSRKLIILVL